MAFEAYHTARKRRGSSFDDTEPGQSRRSDGTPAVVLILGILLLLHTLIC